MRRPADQDARERIVHERQRNVVVIAGAGTGKTRTIIDRAVELLAPTQEDVAAIEIQRMALITFTRRAAGELRFRLRERLLRELEHAARDQPRRVGFLREALGSVDAAFIGTIHGFADRLLRLRPVEADLSPSYTLLEDNADLVHEATLRLQRGAELGTLADELGRFGAHLPPELITEANVTLRAAIEAGVQLERSRAAFGPLPSIEETLARMIETRDVDMPLPSLPEPALDRANEAARQFADMVAKTRGGSTGVARLKRIARALRRLPGMTTPPQAIRLVNETMRGRALYKGRDFQDDGMAWGIYKTIHPDQPRNAWILEKLKGPHRWLATRLVRLAPVACALYERVKAEHEVVDYLDLLIKLRNLLRDDADSRRFYQGLFDHVFVDEFQDTDPLQCEIVFYLCGASTEHRDAGRWDEIDITSGKLTIVGDPKQSIYRFRRADISMYSHAVERLTACGARQERLGTNFRSSAALIDFFNDRLAGLLGRDAVSFDPDTGRAAYDDLSAALPPTAERRAVHVLPYSDAGGEALLAQRGRELEGRMLARYIRWLLASATPVRDVDTGAERPVQPADIAVLACVTTNLPFLLRELDALDVPYTARGGALFSGHPFVRKLLLGLRAIADRHDGVAEATLLQAPFFALDLEDHVAGHVFKKPEEDERRARLDAARDVVAGLRRRRHQQSPGATVRDLIEHSALGRVAATSRNGEQTLAALYEIAHEADRRAALGGLDFDAVTEVFRAWATWPPYLEAPEPIGSGAVRVMTMHGAKGLEFPVTILWDGFQILADRGTSTWQVERDGRAWALNLGPVSVEFPQDGVIERERRFAVEERKRMYYVAATRARDLLVVPVPSAKGRWEYATGTLVADADPATIRLFETYRPDNPPRWASDAAPPRSRTLQPDADLQARSDACRRDFAQQLREAAVPSARPIAATALAAGEAAEDEDRAEIVERERKAEGARFGRVFGLTVHRALELLLGGGPSVATIAVEIAAREHRLDEHRDEAVADVERALAALRGAGIDSTTGTIVAEYPLVSTPGDGTLLTGYIDLLHETADSVSVIDFKTDATRPHATERDYPAYRRQLRLYCRMLRDAGWVGGRTVRSGLLLTATGEILWTPAEDPPGDSAER